MTVKKPVPCSLYDIQGIQEWLDEMALQGLFLEEFTRQKDRAVFRTGDPKPLRYRLDPVGKSKNKDKDREEPYAQMGWKFVDWIPQWYYIFSSDNPEAPELYTDPQSLSVSMDHMIRRKIKTYISISLLWFFLIALLIFISSHSFLLNLLLWGYPQDLFYMILLPIITVIAALILAVNIRRILKIRNTLAQGLPLKAKKRWNRPLMLVIWLPIYILLLVVPRLILPSSRWETFSPENAALSHQWPTIAQLEAVGPSPLEQEPEADGYVRVNTSPFAPVQEFTYYHPLRVPQYPPDFSTTIHYIQASSPKTARWIYQLTLEERADQLKQWQKPTYVSHITDLDPFAPQSWPGLDRLEVASFRAGGQKGWTFAALRGQDILLVSYRTLSRWEDCLPLFLEALDREIIPQSTSIN